MNVPHRLTGYNKASELLTYSHALPSAAFHAAADLAAVPATDPTALGAYPLGEHQARKIASFAGSTIDTDAYDWFLEPAAEELVS